MKKILIIAAVFIFVAVPLLVYALRNVILKRAAETLVSDKSEYGLAVGSLSVNPFTGRFEMSDAYLLNPEGFREDRMVSLPGVAVRYDPLIFFHKEKVLRNVSVDIRNVNLIRNEKGKFNFEPVTERKPREKAEKAKRLPVRIDRLRFRLGTITVKDYTAGHGKPVTLVFDINADKTFTDLDRASGIAKAVGKQVLDNIKLKKTENLKLKDLPDLIESALDAVPEQIKAELLGVGKDREKRTKELNKKLLEKAKELSAEKE